MEPLMLIVDVLSFLINQRKQIVLLDRMQRVDDKLLKENIVIDYRKTKRMTAWLIALVSVVEVGIVIYNFFLFQELMIESLWWFTTCIPLYISSIAKIWYVTLVFNVKQKFSAINDHFESTSKFFEELKKRREPPPNGDNRGGLRDRTDFSVYTGSTMNMDMIGGYLHREIHTRHKGKKHATKAVVPESAFVITPAVKDGILQVRSRGD